MIVSPPKLAFDAPVSGVVTRVPTAVLGESIGEVRRRLVGEIFDAAGHVVVTDRMRFTGLVRIEHLFAAHEGSLIDDVVDRDPPVVRSGDDEEQAAWKAVRHGESALAVVDAEGRFTGLIPPRRMVEVLLREHDEDLARLAGYLASTSSARHATEERVLRRLGHRLPWLFFGLAGAIAAAGVVGRSEAEVGRHVLLAFFVPGIVYMADAVGTQTEALVIRGLSVGVPVRRIVQRELATGLLVGLALATVFLPVGLLLWDDSRIVVAAALALLAACSTATVVAMALPWTLHRLGADPAFGSGPLATVIQDLLSLVIYFEIAAALVPRERPVG